MKQLVDTFNKKPVAIFVITVLLVAFGVLVVKATLTLTASSVTSDGALSLTAGGTNQSITLTPTGTGITNLTGNTLAGHVGLGSNGTTTILWGGATPSYGVQDLEEVVSGTALGANKAINGIYNRLTLENPTLPGGFTGAVYFTNEIVQTDATDTRNWNSLHGNYTEVIHNGTGTVGTGMGIGGEVDEETGAGAMTTAVGNSGQMYLVGGTIATGTATYSFASNLAGGTLSTAMYGHWLQLDNENTAPRVNGLFVDPSPTTVAPTNYAGVYIGTNPHPGTTTNYGLYVQGDPSSFGGNVSIGTTTTAFPLQIWKAVSTTISIGSINSIGCIEIGDAGVSSQLDYMYASSSVMVVTTTKPNFCQ